MNYLNQMNRLAPRTQNAQSPDRIRALLFMLVAVVGLTLARPLAAQSSQRGQPKTPFGLSDLGKLRWIEGNWEATSPGEPSYYERYRFVNDSTIEITYFSDPTFSRETGNGRVYLSVGRIYHTFGSGRWGATHVDTSGVYFIPQANARNTFVWTVKSPDVWTATLRTGVSGREKVTVYELRRIKG